ncbi:sulfatase-like hydrolase/transferase [Ruania alkalisoli]|uniref:Sulfatase-like hydrolase/transferase n=1 Tax=Ruania alkalisoli TaxID=2779775 RepID=A0A7M1SUP9_9MICO|nr:sulfatase-like hydrolase/transferase [Ruania alkalisoli]QOR70664.1 sulfatase-like hydrolase/transferase [Ruania alkalisoli]
MSRSAAGRTRVGADDRPHVLLIMTDQQRFDTIACRGNTEIHTPHLDRLVRRGLTFERGYSTTPVCVPARYTLRSGCEPTRTDIWDNRLPPGRHERLRAEQGPYLAEAMRERGYRTFGIGKFHTSPWDADVGFEVHLHSEEQYETPDQRARDSYASWISTEHAEYDWVDALMGERTEMYYMPQTSPLPASLTVEAWAADRAVEQIEQPDPRPFFGAVSFIGPHPPFAPPMPYHRMYDPDRMPLPVRGDLDVDHLDQQLPWMNAMTFAENVDDDRARSLKARYYGEISYIDACIGTILDAVDRLPDPDNVLICFVSDHGDLLGDHSGWQKESFFEASTRIPFLLSWPRMLPADQACADLVCLTDIFGICTTAAGRPDLRQGHDVLGTLLGRGAPRRRLIGYHGRPRTRRFKAMVVQDRWKLIFLANGGHRLLFDVESDPDELTALQHEHPGVVAELTRALIEDLIAEGCSAALVDGAEGTHLWTQPYEVWERTRIYQFDKSRGITGFPENPATVCHDPVLT